jgi:hypothetical protein
LKLNSDYASNQNPWILGEWLVSYHGGYVRRGLAGSIILEVSDVFGVAIEYVFQMALGLIFGIFLIILFRVARRNSVIASAGKFLLITSPMSFSFFVVDPAAVGRKEFLLYLFAIVWYLWIARKLERIGNQPPKLFHGLLFTAAFSLVLMSHEGFAFYTAILVFPVAIYSLYKKIPPKRIIPWVLPILLPSVIVSFLALWNSSLVTIEDLCNPLLARGLDEIVCEGALEFAVQSSIAGIDFALADVSSIASSWIAYTCVAILGVIPIIIFGTKLLKSHNLQWRPEIVGATLFLVFLSAPLFVFGSDWGRYISAYLSISTVAILIFSTRAYSVVESLPTGQSRSNGRRSSITIYLLGTAQFLFFGVSVRGGEYKNTLMTIRALFQRAVELLFN